MPWIFAVAATVVGCAAGYFAYLAGTEQGTKYYLPYLGFSVFGFTCLALLLGTAALR